MIISVHITVAINFNFCGRNQGLLKITVAKLAVELRVSSTAAVAEVRHAEVDDESAATGGMVEIMSNFNISTLAAPGSSYFELRLDNVADGAGVGGRRDVSRSSHEQSAQQSERCTY